MKNRERKKQVKIELIKALKEAEKSGFIKNFNRDDFLKKLHQKNL